MMPDKRRGVRAVVARGVVTQRIRSEIVHIPTKQKRRSTGQGAKKPLNHQRPEKRSVPDGTCGHELSRPKRVSWLPAYGMMSATSIPVSWVVSL
jgi:hypothetical protein